MHMHMHMYMCMCMCMWIGFGALWVRQYAYGQRGTGLEKVSSDLCIFWAFGAVSQNVDINPQTHIDTL